MEAVERHALAVSCPRCAAKKGAGCVKDGEPVEGYHHERVQLWGDRVIWYDS